MKILNLFELSAQNRAKLAALGDVEVIDGDKLGGNAKNIDVIYGWGKPAESVLAQSNKLKFVQSNSAGVDYLPLAEFKAKQISLANVSGIHAEPISEMVLAYILSFARGIEASHAARREHNWIGDQIRNQIYTLTNRTVVILGTGHIGQGIAEKLKAFGVTTIGVSRHGRPAAHFDRVVTDKSGTVEAAKADFVVNIMPLTAETRHFFNPAFFDQMENQPVFINVGRGPSVDTKALIDALDTHQLAGAALDVFENEPLEATSPLWEMDNVIITPHISGGFREYGQAAFNIFYKNLTTFIQTGTIAINQVNLSAGY